MKTGSTRGLTCAGVALLGWAAFQLASSPAPAYAAAPPTTPQNVRVAACKICHLAEHEGLKDYLDDYGSRGFINFDSARLWKEGLPATDPKSIAVDADRKGDPHQYIYKALDPKFSKAAAKMQRLLGAGNAGYKLLEDTRCLTCHAVDAKPTQTAKQLDQFIRDDKVGMGCTACHGLEGRWLSEHYDAVGTSIPWRTMLPADKAAAGMANLRDPAVKATMCASCHVGSAEEAKVVTHEMYAAGHPWLPPFELASFMEGEPMHWKVPEELMAITSSPKALETFRYKSGDNYYARHVAVGAIASLKAEMGQVAADAMAVQPGKTVDFARFDCASCHHELEYPGLRQSNYKDGRIPGRIPLKSWAGVLPPLVVEHAGQGKAEFDAKWAAVKKAAYDKPFGEPKELAKAAGDLAAWCDGYLKVVNVDGPLTYDANSTDALKAKLKAKLGEKGTAGDQEAAAQLLWAYRVLSPTDKREKHAELSAIVPLNVRAGKLDWLQHFSNGKWDGFADAFAK